MLTNSTTMIIFLALTEKELNSKFIAVIIPWPSTRNSGNDFRFPDIAAYTKRETKPTYVRYPRTDLFKFAFLVG